MSPQPSGGMTLDLSVEEFAERAAASSHYLYGYQTITSQSTKELVGEFDVYADHLASIANEPGGGKPDSYWKQLVQTSNLKVQSDRLLETQDKRHRMSELLEACLKIYEARKGGTGGQTFYQWLDNIPEWERVVMIRNTLIFHGATSAKQAANTDGNIKPSMVNAFLYGVKYLDRAGRKNYRLHFAHGAATLNGKPFETKLMRTVFSGAGFAIWVQSPKDNFYAANHVKGHFHHSSFLAGGAVKCGGEIVAVNGKIKLISAKSGHYQPSKIHFANAVRTFGVKGVDLAQLSVVVWRDEFSKPSVISAIDFLKKPDVWETWGRGKVDLKF